MLNRDPIAIMKVDSIFARQVADLEMVVVVGRVLEASLIAKPADQGIIFGSWTESHLREVAAEIQAPDEPDLRVEVLLNDQPIEGQAVAIGRIRGLSAVTEVVVAATAGLGLGDV